MPRYITLNSIFGFFSSKSSTGSATPSSGPTLPQNTVMFWASDATNDNNIPPGFAFFEEGNNRSVLSTTQSVRINTLIPQVAPGQISFQASFTGNSGRVTDNATTSHSGPAISGPGAAPFTNPFPGFATAVSNEHSHTSSFSITLGTDFQPSHKPIPAIKTTGITSNMIPRWSIVFSDVQPANTFSDYTPNAIVETYKISRQDLPANVTCNAIIITSNVTGSSGAHIHSGTVFGGAPRPSAPRGNPIAAGDHTHGIQHSVRNSVPVRHLRTWIANEDTPIPSNIILMYSGTLESLPAGWRVCNGTNTVLMNNTFIGHNNTTNYIVAYGAFPPSGSYPWLGPEQISGFLFGATIPVSTSYFSDTWSHNHTGGTTTSTRPFSASGANHGPFSVPHTHQSFVLSTRNVTKFFEPNAIILAFITNRPL